MRTSRLFLYRLVCRILPEMRFFWLKSFLLKWCGAKIGKGVRVCSSAWIYGNGELVIGDDVWIGERCFISPNSGAGIKIGSCCDLAPEVMIINGTHHITPAGNHIAGDGYSLPVELGDGVWVGARAILMPGVVLGSKTVVAAGAVVCKTSSRGTVLLAGIPAKEVKCYD